MDEYRKHVSDIHAPESLINMTLERIHSEQKADKRDTYDKKHKISNIIKLTTPIIAAAAAAMVVVTQLPEKNTLVYNTMPDIAFRMGNISMDFGTFTDSRKITIEEYDAYLEINLEDLINEMELVKSDIEVKYDTKGKNIVSDACTLHYESDEGSVVVELSKTKNMVPEVLSSAEQSTLKGYRLWVAENEQADVLIAAGKKDEISYYIRANKVSKKQFEKILEIFINIL